MTRNHHRYPHRAALALAAAAATLFAGAPARAQMLGQNIFGGTNTSAATISTTNATVSAGQSTTAPVGPGFNGTVSLGIGALDTLSETINVGGNGTLTASETGQGVLNLLGNPIGTGAGGTFSATKTITAVFAPNQSYSFTLTTTTNSALNLLSGINVTFTTVDNGTTTTVYNASNGVGLLGAVQVINLFGGGTQGTFNFTTPANVDTAVPITVTISGGLTASALGSTFTFTNGSLVAVPEPGTLGAFAVGIAGVVLLRLRHRLALV